MLERGAPRKTPGYAATMDELDYAIRLRMMQNVATEITLRNSLEQTHGKTNSPNNLSVQNWGVTYADLEHRSRISNGVR